MRVVLLLPLIAAAVSFGQAPAASPGGPITVLEFRWNRDRKIPPPPEPAGIIPARAVIAANKKFEREARANLPPGAIDPNTMTVDGRSEALEKINQESRTQTLPPVEGFNYQAKLRNEAETAISVIFLEFNFTEIADPSKRTTRQFLCAARIKPKEKTDIHVFSSFGPSDTISVANLAGDPEALFRSDVTINRIEYANGAIIQRADWHFKDLKAAIAHATSTPWGDEMCRAL